jgi:hypothetical protein
VQRAGWAEARFLTVICEAIFHRFQKNLGLQYNWQQRHSKILIVVYDHLIAPVVPFYSSEIC